MLLLSQQYLLLEFTSPFAGVSAATAVAASAAARDALSCALPAAGDATSGAGVGQGLLRRESEGKSFVAGS